MPLYELTHEALRLIPTTTMHEQHFREREDLQRLLKISIKVIGDDLFLLAEEFSQWEDSKRRVDLLALDRNGSLVVVELKRSEDGGHMELQAIRYAAMVSTLRFDQAVDAHAKFLKAESREAEAAEAEARILDFLGVTEPPDDFGQSVRIVLVSPGFSPELTTAVLWLRDNGLDIRCVRLRPYKLDQCTLLEIDEIIPLPEAKDYMVRLKEKQEETRQAAESSKDHSRYDLTANGKTYRNLTKKRLILRAVASAVEAGLTLEDLKSIIPSRQIIVVDGHPRGDAFEAVARKSVDASGYKFQPRRFFMDDDDLIDVGDKTVAISDQWGLPSLTLIDKIISAEPSAGMSFKRADEPD